MEPVNGDGGNLVQNSTQVEGSQQAIGASVPTTQVQDPKSVNAQEVNLVNKRPLKSVVWNHFKKQKIGAAWKAVCNYCGKKLGANPTDGTTHLRTHFERCAAEKNHDIRQAVLKPKTDGNGKVTLKAYSYNEELSRTKLATMIIAHEYPLSLVDHWAFRDFVESLQPLFKVVSRNTIRSDVIKIFEHEKSRTLATFEKNSSRFAITTDMWTASNQDKGYMVITAHFVDDSWKMQSRIIRFVHVPCPHTAEVLCDVLVHSLVEWNIERKVSTFTLDNCSTNDKLVNLILKKVPSKNFLLGGKLMHMRCCAHILNLIVKEGLTIIDSAIEKVHQSVVFWTATPKRCEKFEETVRLLKVPYNRKLVLDCRTRWNSTYLMLSVALLYKDAFNRLFLLEPFYQCVPLEEEWELAKKFCDRLGLFHSITELFSGTNYPTANLYFPKICEVKLALSEWLVCGEPCIEEIASKMIEKFEKYWSQIHGIMAVAIVLDPRFKLMLLEFYFPRLFGAQAKDEIQKVKDLCFELLFEYSEKAKLLAFNSSQSSSILTQSSNTQEDHLSQFDMFVASHGCQKENNVKIELDLYLQEGVIPRTIDFDILSWWKNAYGYPTLKLLARDILAIPVSTVASESAFSTSGRFISPHRSKLTPELLEAFVCAQNWIWNDRKGSTRDHPHFQPFHEEIIDEEGKSTMNTNEVEDLTR
ncbi:Zinc finger BED domain-containing protein RICESLEEPER 2 [Euphorbia peplus]|nr:Zinc finger BED domain-containing protein RICESLEEPER 2 [Euphorbia peplus]